MSCPRLTSTLSDEQAHAVVEPVFVELQALFAEQGLARLEVTALEVDTGLVHDTGRHFAMCRDDGRLIIVAGVIAELPLENLTAILAHEFGHATDFSYPTRFQVARLELIEHDGEWRGRRRPLADVDGGVAFARRRQWESRTDDAVERTADAIAESVLGRPVLYDGPCMIQRFEAGRRRPPGLR